MKKTVFILTLALISVCAKAQIIIDCPECGHKITLYITTGDSTKIKAVHDTTPNNQTATSDGTSKQCQATTKAGTQCSRQAIQGQDYCWQHAANKYSQTSSEKATTSQQTTTGGGGRCKAITKAGTRCSRSARSNGYCWQHGG